MSDYMSIDQCLEWARDRGIGIDISNIDDGIYIELEDIDSLISPSIHGVTIGWHEKEMFNKVLADVIVEMWMDKESSFGIQK